MKRDRRGRFLTAGLSRKLERQAAVGKRRGGLRDGGGIQCEYEAVVLEEIGVNLPRSWDADTPIADEPDGAGIGRSLATGYCRLCHGKFSSRSLRNAFGKVPVAVESSDKQRRVEQVFFSDFQRLLGVSVQQDPALPPFVCKNCHAQFYKCRSVLKTFIQKVNTSPTGQAKTKTRGSVMHSRLNTEGPCLVDLVTSSPQCLHRLVIWSHAHAGDCQSVPNLQSMLSSQYCGIIQAVWGCEGGHTYVMDADSDSNTLLLDTSVSQRWNLDKGAEACLTGNGTCTYSSEALNDSSNQHDALKTDKCQPFPCSELTLETLILENQTSSCTNIPHQQLNSNVSSTEREPHTISMEGPINRIESSDLVAEEPVKDENSDLSEGDDPSEDELRERNCRSLDESFSPSSNNKGASKRSVHDETKRPEVPKERKKPGPKPGWKNKFKPDREELPTIYRCPYQGCTAVYRGPDGMKKHIKEHHEQVRERPCPHPGCNKVFMIDRYLQRHVKLIHTEERNYICDQCGQTFKQRKHLSVHQMRHSGAKPLQCEICGFQCRQRASLKYHMTKHKAETELEFACDQCGKRFEKAHNLNVHMSMVHPLTQNHDLATPLQTEQIILREGEENPEIPIRKNLKPELAIDKDSR